MSKTLEQVAKESAKNSRMPLTTQGGYIFEEGFIAGAEHVKKEYEEKLRWIPVSEELPPLHEDVLLKCESSFIDKGCLIHLSGDNMFSSSSGDLDIVTHWRPIHFL